MIQNRIPISYYLPYYSRRHKRLVPGAIPRSAEFFEEMKKIRDGSYTTIIQECRSLTEKTSREEFKAKHLRALTISGTCRGWRKISNMERYSGLLGVDIDATVNPQISNWSHLRNYFGDRPSVVSSFLSASGKGLYFVVRSKKESHYELYDYLAWEIYKTKKIIVDPSGADYLRLRFVSDDPGLILKEDISNIPFVVPSVEYKEWRKQRDAEEKAALEQLRKDFGDIQTDPKALFERFVDIQEKKGRKFTKGNRHYTLVGICGMCIKYNFPIEKCQELIIDKFVGVEETTEEDCIYTINHVYNTYTK